MENSLENYKKDFKEETKELIVKIFYFDCNRFMSIDDEYNRLSFRISEAIDVETGEVVELKDYTWINYLFLANDKLPFDFKEGDMCRVLVREARERNEFSDVYYLEKVLETNVIEKRLDASYKFLNDYDVAEFDLNVLVEKSNSYRLDRSYKVCYFSTLASFNPITEELNCKGECLRWLEKIGDNNFDKKFTFENLHSYKVKVRKNKSKSDDYLVVDAVEIVESEQFGKIKLDYLKPKVISSDIGTFVYDNKLKMYKGIINYKQDEIAVSFVVENRNDDVNVQLDRLMKIKNDFENIYTSVLNDVIVDKLDLANQWNEDDVITKEDFEKCLKLKSIVIYDNGKFNFYYDAGDIFYDHFINVCFDENGNYNYSRLEG